MTDEDDFGSAGYDRLTTLLSGVISAIHDRPADALMLIRKPTRFTSCCPPTNASCSTRRSS